MPKNVHMNFSGLKKLQKNVDKLSKQKNVPLYQLFTQSFISKNTNFSNLDEFFNACNIHSNEDLEAISDAEIDKFVIQNTKFQSWQEMLDTSVAEYYKNELGF